MLRRLLHCRYTTKMGTKKIKVLASCDDEAFKKVEQYELEDIYTFKVTKREDILI